MTTFTGRFTPSLAGGQAASGAVTFGADISERPVYLSGEVIPSHAFARLMLTLSRVVRMNLDAPERDHSDYQNWVRGEYLKELPAQQAAVAGEVQRLITERQAAWSSVYELKQRARELLPEYDVFWRERQRFWRWLYNHNREAWVVLDPIVSVQPDAVFFEAFSQDESIFARVRLPIAQLRADAPLAMGTTNIDFSVGLEREFARVRSYRPLRLTVGAQAVGASTDVSMVTERKIDLPDSWVRGLVEVQAALALSAVEVTLSSDFVADIIAILESEREKHGPRALTFTFDPGKPVSVVIEPWGRTLVDVSSLFKGDRKRVIRIWGRRRLSVLADLLPHTRTIRLRAIDDGMPSFWTIEIEGVELTIGLSGWTSQDWAGKARFAAMIPASLASPEQVEQARVILEERGRLSVDDLSRALNLSPVDSRSILQALCAAGQAMFDVNDADYRWRALFPQLEMSRIRDIGREEGKGVELARAAAVSVQSQVVTPEGVHRIVAHVSDDGHDREVLLESDVDGRVLYAQCDCSHFRFHKLRQGPCRHIVATSVKDVAP
jgi:hypothetical protein